MAEVAVKMDWSRRLDIHRNWPVVCIGTALALIILMLIDNASWEGDTPQHGQTILYLMLFFRHTLSHYLIFFVCVLSLLSLFGLLITFTHIWPTVVFIFIVNLFLIGIGLIGYYLEGANLRYFDNVVHNGHVYHLIYYESWYDGGDSYSTDFVVYECDSANMVCSVVNTFYDTYGMQGTPRQGNFSLDAAENILYLEIEDVSNTERHRVID